MSQCVVHVRPHWVSEQIVHRPFFLSSGCILYVYVAFYFVFICAGGFLQLAVRYACYCEKNVF